MSLLPFRRRPIDPDVVRLLELFDYGRPGLIIDFHQHDEITELRRLVRVLWEKVDPEHRHRDRRAAELEATCAVSLGDTGICCTESAGHGGRHVDRLTPGQPTWSSESDL
ncbi:MAG: hypothetical protein P1V51_24555 [Deltaproteobacteria bacterium]|nr:hypothetical protein [Deltaproteobacteria bacterium]